MASPLDNAHAAYNNAVKVGDEWYAKQTTAGGRAAAAQGKTDAMAKAAAAVKALQTSTTGQYNYNPQGLAQAAQNRVAQAPIAQAPAAATTPGGTNDFRVKPPLMSQPASPIIHSTPNSPWAPIQQPAPKPSGPGLDLPFDLDLADERSQGAGALNRTNTELDNILNMLAQGQQTQTRDLNRFNEDDQRDDLNRFASRGMAYSSGYGQEVADSGQQHLNRMSELNNQIATGRNNVTNQRLNAQTDFNNIMSQTGRNQAERSALKAGELETGQRNAELNRQNTAGQQALNSAKMVDGKLYDTRTGRLAFIGPNGEAATEIQQPGMVGTVMQDGRVAYYYPIGAAGEQRNSTPNNPNATQNKAELDKANAAYNAAVKQGDEWYAKQTTDGGRAAAAKGKTDAMARAAAIVASEKAKLGMK